MKKYKLLLENPGVVQQYRIEVDNTFDPVKELDVIWANNLECMVFNNAIHVKGPDLITVETLFVRPRNWSSVSFILMKE